MDKFQNIRPIALGIAIKNNKLLVMDGYDSKKGQHFYRCLGGGIEFLEKGEDALKREFKEELNKDIKVNNFLGLSENIFNYEGKDAHELVLFYSIDIEEEDTNHTYKILDELDNTIVSWEPIEEFKKGNKIIYPEGVLKYLG